MLMKYRKYVCAVIHNNGKFLILQRCNNWKGWELLKGGILPKEKILSAIKREVKEETGHSRIKVKKTMHSFKYKWPKDYMKDGHIFHGGDNRLFIISIPNKKVKIDKKEHNNYKWVTEKQALKLLTYNNHKRALRYAIKVLK